VPGFNALLGLDVVGFRDGRFWIGLDAGESHMHEKGFVHGGVVLALLDTAMSRAVRHDRPKGAYLPTIEFNASFLRPLGAGPVQAWGRIVQAGRTLVRAEGAVIDDDGRACAAGRATFISPPDAPDDAR
jgi:uncharacterized protein (TIGR00369 family)